MTEPGAAITGESEPARHDRQLIELLNEIRVVTTGVQVLFAFLLVLPFSSRWEASDDFLAGVYFATLMCATLASALLLAPAALHRLRFHRGDKALIIAWANRTTIAGSAALALAMTGSVLLVTDALFGLGPAIAAASVVFVVLAGLWYLLPLSPLFRYGRSARDG